VGEGFNLPDTKPSNLKKLERSRMRKRGEGDGNGIRDTGGKKVIFPEAYAWGRASPLFSLESKRLAIPVCREKGTEFDSLVNKR